MIGRLVCSLLTGVIFILKGYASTWSEWWTYGGISGSEFWGLVNPDWFLCTKGLHQSPINILPSKLIFDPNLSPVQFDRLRTSVTLTNTGHDLKLTLDDHVTSYVNVTGGPLAYQYRVMELNIHFGEADNRGSQHLIDGKALPGEIQIIGFNSDLYHNMSDAVRSSRGLCGIAIFLQISDKGNEELEILKNHLPDVIFKGKSSKIKSFMLADLLPPTEHYVTYDGSLSQPACDESVTWVVYNKPIYVSNEFMLLLRKLMQGDEQNLKAPLSDNFRRIQALNNRPIRTNINFGNSTPECTVIKQTTYETNFHSTNF